MYYTQNVLLKLLIKYILLLFSPKEYPDYDLYYPYYVPLNGLDVKMAKGALQGNGISGDIAQQVRGHIVITICHVLIYMYKIHRSLESADTNNTMKYFRAATSVWSSPDATPMVRE